MSQFPSISRPDEPAQASPYGTVVCPGKLGRYELQEELGRGQMGVVYRGRDPKIDRQVAIKTIQLEAVAHGLNHGTLLRRFSLEAQTAGRLSHANIATIYDVGEENGITFFAMEYVEGRTLEGLLRESPIPRSEEAINILTQIAAGIDAAHSHGVVHRDIKPANILIRADGQVKITDFGIARFSTAELTQTGTALGTPSYMSPEQLSGEEIDGRTDIYAMGVIAFRMLTGEKPYQAVEIPTLICKIMQGEVRDPLRINPLLPQECKKVLCKALAKERKDRYSSAETFVAALKKVLHDPVEVRRLMELTRHHQRPKGWWHRWSPWVAGGLLIVAAAAVSFSLLREREKLLVVGYGEMGGESLTDDQRQTFKLLANAERLLSEGRRQEAMDAYEAAWQLSPDTVRLRKAAYVQFLLSAAEEVSSRDHLLAAGYYGRLLELSPDYLEIYVRLGELHYQYREWEDARNNFLEVLRRDPERVDIRFYYAKVLVQKGAHEEALGELWEVVESNPPFMAEARAWRGLCWENLGEFHKAKVNYRKALAIDSDNRLALQRIQQLGG